MLAKCANPSCSTPLVYLREGKIFMVESHESRAVVDIALPVRPKMPNRVEHFWLCGPCSLEMTLIFEHHKGVQVVPKTLRPLRSQAS